MKFNAYAFAVLIASTFSVPVTAQTAAWPARPITLLVATPAGNAPDLVARIIAEKVGKELGQPVIVDNRPGANGIIAMNVLRGARPDGYTLALWHSSVSVVTPFTYKEAKFDMERDVETVALAGRAPFMFVVNPNHKAKSLEDLLSMAKANPGQVTVGNPTRASLPHLAAEITAQKANVKFQNIFFSTSPQGIQGVVNGDIATYVDAAGPLLPLVKAGRLRALAITSETDMAGMEGIPLANKTVPGLNVYGWFMFHAPKGTPPAIVQRLNAEINKAMQAPDVVARFRDTGIQPTQSNVEESRRFLSSEKALFGGMIRSLGMEPE